MKRFQGGLVFKAHRLVCHSTLGVRVIKKKRRLARATYLAKEVARPDAGHFVPVQRENSLLTTYWSEYTLSS